MCNLKYEIKYLSLQAKEILRTLYCQNYMTTLFQWDSGWSKVEGHWVVLGLYFYREYWTSHKTSILESLKNSSLKGIVMRL